MVTWNSLYGLGDLILIWTLPEAPKCWDYKCELIWFRVTAYLHKNNIQDRKLTWPLGLAVVRIFNVAHRLVYWQLSPQGIIISGEWSFRCINREQSSGHLGNDLTGNCGTTVFPSSSNSLPWGGQFCCSVLPRFPPLTHGTHPNTPNHGLEPWKLLAETVLSIGLTCLLFQDPTLEIILTMKKGKNRPWQLYKTHNTPEQSNDHNQKWATWEGKGVLHVYLCSPYSSGKITLYPLPSES